LVIGGIGVLIGLGGGEFRLPLLVGLIGFTVRAAVPMNQILSLITLVTALIVRWHTGSLVGVGASLQPCWRLGWAASRLHGSPRGCCRASRITDLNARSRFC
jgi:uncharacterized membrane protein YfcA